MIIVETTLWRCTYYGEKLEDISDVLLDAYVDVDVENDLTWTLDARITYEGWKSLNPYLDWISPHLKCIYPDGKVYEGPLGLYFLLDSPEEHTELSGEVRIKAVDHLWLLARQGFARRLTVEDGFPKYRAVEEIVGTAALSDVPRGKRLYAIPETNHTFRTPREWYRELNRLEIANEVLEGMGCYPLWTTKRGIMVSRRRNEARLKNRHPVRTFSAHVPDHIELLDKSKPWGGFPSNIVGTVHTEPGEQDLVNEILMVNDDPDIPGISVKAAITNPKNPRSSLQSQGRRRTLKRTNKYVEDNATAKEVAESLLDELSTHNKVIRIEVHPDPETEFTRETVACLIWNARGERIAVGQYSVHRIGYGLQPTNAMMRLNLGRIDDANDVILGTL